jgi:hypothetical protein
VPYRVLASGAKISTMKIIGDSRPPIVKLESLRRDMQLPENRRSRRTIQDMQLIERILLRQSEADVIRLSALGVRWE